MFINASVPFALFALCRVPFAPDFSRPPTCSGRLRVPIFTVSAKGRTPLRPLCSLLPVPFAPFAAAVPFAAHDILIGEMVASRVHDGDPLIHFASCYRQLAPLDGE